MKTRTNYAIRLLVMLLAATAVAAPQVSAQANTQTAAQQALLNPNSATRAQLLALPGLSAASADAIIATRPVRDMLGVDRILVANGLTEEQRDAVYARLWLPINLNTSVDEEILLIPGIGARMLREFKEYRPYLTMAQFSREIGKYVDNAEVARLEKYVSVPAPQQ